MRSVVVVLPASMWAMMPILRVFSSVNLRGMESLLCLRSSCVGLPRQRAKKRALSGPCRSHAARWPVSQWAMSRVTPCEGPRLLVARLWAVATAVEYSRGMTVRWSGMLVAIFLALWGSAADASAGVRALARAPGAGPALVGSSVLWSSREAVFAAPVSGGAVARVGGVSAGTELVAGDGMIAARGGDSLSAARYGGAFARVLPDAGAPPLFGIVPSVQPSAAGLVVLENDDVWLRRGGRREEVALPPGADPGHVAVAGALGVAPVPEGELIVFSLDSGIEEREISLGPFDGFNVTGLAVSPSGEVAASVPVGDGTDALVYAAPGADRVRVLARGLRFGRVAVGGGRVAFVSCDR